MQQHSAAVCEQPSVSDSEVSHSSKLSALSLEPEVTVSSGLETHTVDVSDAEQLMLSLTDDVTDMSMSGDVASAL